METLKISTIINRKYQVFDRSGHLPFSIVFGLCRRSTEDTDPRLLVINTAETILDVPYALKHEFLSIHGKDAETKRGFLVDVGKLDQFEGANSTVTLASPVGREKNWKESLTVYEYHVKPGSVLASLFEPGNNYEIRIKKGGPAGGRGPGDFGGTGHTYIDTTRNPASTESLKLVYDRADGCASFLVVDSLPWPPEIETRMQQSQGKDATLEITVSNQGGNTITVQTRGRQRYLSPWGPMYPREEHSSRPRLIDSQTPAPGGHLQIIDLLTKEIVREVTKPPICQLYGPHDPRPKLDFLIMLKPGEQLVREIDISGLLSKLLDGTYGLRMEPRGMWWCPGSYEVWRDEADDRVPHHLYKTLIPPLVLQCEDIVEVCVSNGVVSLAFPAKPQNG
jgi:hypothetical protein